MSLWRYRPIEANYIINSDRLLVLPKEIYDWALAYLKNILEKDVDDAEQELRNLKKRATDAQASLDTLLLKAAQTKDNLAEEFLRLAR
ncbi:MAG: hypothetical protein MUO33_07270 [Sedimentisphaerales bacterium]|nr:hypothetical protein [Sedimentisphaerales bacterium]